MKLEQTVEMMTSDDYRERFRAEYHQLAYRKNKLQKMIKSYKEGTLSFEPKCSIDLLEWQYRVMLDYEVVLKRRAQIEGIPL